MPDCQSAIIHLTVQPLWGTKETEKSVNQAHFILFCSPYYGRGKKRFFKHGSVAGSTTLKYISGVTCALSCQVFLPELPTDPGAMSQKAAEVNPCRMNPHCNFASAFRQVSCLKSKASETCTN